MRRYPDFSAKNLDAGTCKKLAVHRCQSTAAQYYLFARRQQERIKKPVRLHALTLSAECWTWTFCAEMINGTLMELFFVVSDVLESSCAAHSHQSVDHAVRTAQGPQWISAICRNIMSALKSCGCKMLDRHTHHFTIPERVSDHSLHPVLTPGVSDC